MKTARSENESRVAPVVRLIDLALKLASGPDQTNPPTLYQSEAAMNQARRRQPVNSPK